MLATFRFLAPKISFSASGPPKKLPERYVYHYFCAGGAQVPIWAQKSTFGFQNREISEIPHILLKLQDLPGKSTGILILVKYFLGNTWRFDTSKFMNLMKFPRLSWNFFCEIRSNPFFTFDRIIMISHLCVSLPQMLLKPMEYYTFWVVLGAMGSLFEKKCVFFEILGKCKNIGKSRSFHFLSEKEKNHEIHGIVKTPIFP